MNLRHTLLPFVLLAALNGCSSDSNDGPKTDEEFAQSVTQGVHDKLGKDVDALHSAAIELQNAAPAAARGWSATEDAAAISAMTSAWISARSAYERSEGAIAPLFPDIDTAIDARYDDFMEALKPAGDPDLFDGEGATGMHSIERILFTNTTPASVVAVEATLPGYVASAWPATAEESAEFKTKLCQKLVDDTAQLKTDWVPARIVDLEGAFGGLIALMNEQREKVNKAASEEEESRYAQRTLADIRDNLAGTRVAYGVFRPWILSKQGGADVDAAIQAGFDDLDATYASVSGDAFPPLPPDFSAENPTAANLETDFGKLFSRVQDAVNPNRAGSIVDGMNKAAVLLNFPEFVEK